MVDKRRVEDRKIGVWIFCLFLIGVNFVLGFLVQSNPGVPSYGVWQYLLFIIVVLGLAVAWSEHQS